MRDILVALSDVAERTGHVEYAARLAAEMKSVLTALHISQPFDAMPHIDSPALLPEAIRLLREHRRAALGGGPAFVEWAAQRSVRHSAWKIANGSPAEAVAEIGSWHDLVVLAGASPAGAGSLADLGEILLTAASACLVIPAGVVWNGTPQRIALAWNDSPQAIRAISAARPLLDRASHIIVLEGKSRAPIAPGAVQPAFKLAEYLARHDYAVEFFGREVDDRDAGESLQAAATEVNADLLVMGAYGRARFSEWILGGATRHLLQHASQPVLLRH